MDDRRRGFLEALAGVLPGREALQEACGLIYGCDSYEGKQGWLAMFFGTHDDGLEQLSEKIANLQEDARDLAKDEAMQMNEAEAREGPIPNEYVEYTPVYKSYLQYCRGETRTPYCESDLGDTGLLSLYQERLRWRKIFDKLTGNLHMESSTAFDEIQGGCKYSSKSTAKKVAVHSCAHLKNLNLTEQEKIDVERLDHQLRTLRLFDAKKVEIQRELVTRVNLGVGGSVTPDYTLGSPHTTPGNPQDPLNPLGGNM